MNKPNSDSALSAFFRFRNRQDEKVNGISTSAKVLRKRRNLVSMRFNMMNWVLESVSLILVTIDKDNVFVTLLVTGRGKPLVYLFLVLPWFNVYKIFITFSKKTSIIYVLGLLSWH